MNKKLIRALAAMLRNFDEWDGDDESITSEASVARNKTRAVYRRAKGVLRQARKAAKTR